MGILPLEFTNGESAESLGIYNNNLGLTGKETFDIDLKEGNLSVG